MLIIDILQDICGRRHIQCVVSIHCSDECAAARRCPVTALKDVQQAQAACRQCQAIELIWVADVTATASHAFRAHLLDLWGALPLSLSQWTPYQRRLYLTIALTCQLRHCRTAGSSHRVQCCVPVTAPASLYQSDHLPKACTAQVMSWSTQPESRAAQSRHAANMLVWPGFCTVRPCQHRGSTSGHGCAS